DGQIGIRRADRLVAAINADVAKLVTPGVVELRPSSVARRREVVRERQSGDVRYDALVGREVADGRSLAQPHADRAGSQRAIEPEGKERAAGELAGGVERAAVDQFQGRADDFELQVGVAEAGHSRADGDRSEGAADVLEEGGLESRAGIADLGEIEVVVSRAAVARHQADRLAATDRHAHLRIHLDVALVDAVDRRQVGRSGTHGLAAGYSDVAELVGPEPVELRAGTSRGEIIAKWQRGALRSDRVDGKVIQRDSGGQTDADRASGQTQVVSEGDNHAVK